MTNPNHEVERFEPHTTAGVPGCFGAPPTAGMLPMKEGQWVRHSDYEKDIAAAEEEARVYAEAQTKAEAECDQWKERATLFSGRAEDAEDRHTKVDAALGECQAERDQARDLNRGNRAEAEKAWLKVQALEEEIERLRGELGTAEDVAAGALACDNCDNGIYYEGDEWTPCTECEQGKTLAEHFKTCAREAKAQALAEVREAVEIVSRDWPAVMDRAIAECPKPDPDEACVECIVEAAGALILSTLEGTQGESAEDSLVKIVEEVDEELRKQGAMEGVPGETARLHQCQCRCHTQERDDA